MNEKDKTQERYTFTASAVQLDAQGAPPSRIPLMVTGNWPNSVKGNFSVGMDDLKQMKANFDAGRGFPTEDASTGLPIDFEHKYLERAAAWIKGLELHVDQADPTKGILYASPIEWTAEGAQAVKDGKYKMISPSGYFGKHGGKLAAWPNPQNLKETVANVLDGAGLTNFPFLRGMTPIRADATGDFTKDAGQNANANLVFVYDVRNQKEEPSMNLDALRVKERDALSVPELDFLAEHKKELSTDEAKKFQLDATVVEDNKVELSAEDKQTLDAIKGGTKKLVDASSEVVEKTRLDALEGTINRYREQEVKDLLTGHVKRGAIKQDQTDFWSKQMLAATDEGTRKDLETALAALPSNEQLAVKARGTGEDVVAGATAREQLDVLAKAEVAKAAKDGKTLLYADALKQVYHANDDLRKNDLVEMGVK